MTMKSISRDIPDTSFDATAGGSGGDGRRQGAARDRFARLGVVVWATHAKVGRRRGQRQHVACLTFGVRRVRLVRLLSSVVGNSLSAPADAETAYSRTTRPLTRGGARCLGGQGENPVSGVSDAKPATLNNNKLASD